MWENNCSEKKMWNCNKTINFDLPIKGNVSIVSDLQSFYFQWSFFLAIIKHCLFSIMWTSSKNMLPNRNKHKIKSRTEYVSMWNLHAHFRQKWRIKCKLITFQMENESNSFLRRCLQCVSGCFFFICCCRSYKISKGNWTIPHWHLTCVSHR